MTTGDAKLRKTTELQSMLVESQDSALDKYIRLNIGQDGFWPLIRYELASWFLSPMPGAAGLFLRGSIYPRLLRSAGKKLVVGRNVCIRHHGRIRVGTGVIVDDNCVLDAKGESHDGITLGDRVVIGRNTILSCKGGSIQIGDNSNISANCMVMSESKLVIGKNVLIAGMAYIVAGGNHGTERTDIPIIQQPMIDRGGITIADNCWLGANVTVLDGVEIGHDSIVGAGAVVTESLPPLAIAVGVPAKVVRWRQ